MKMALQLRCGAGMVCVLNLTVLRPFCGDGGHRRGGHAPPGLVSRAESPKTGFFLKASSGLMPAVSERCLR